MSITIPDDLVERSGGRIILLVMDGLGGLPDPATGLTELETASTPNLDRLARTAALGLHQPVGAGITPGSGPGHLALFGYHPMRWNIGRGVLSALGVGFDLRPGDVATRLNFATIDAQGRVKDRRAGRPSDDENKRLVRKLQDEFRALPGVEVFFAPEKEHRLVLILRAPGLRADLADTDPQETGVPPLAVTPTDELARDSARLVQQVLDAANRILADEPKANSLLARGFAAYQRYPSFTERFGLRASAQARYPMYLGVARLVGMDTAPIAASDEVMLDALAERFLQYDFHFVHFKAVDSRGEDGDFAGKVKAIEHVDTLVPRVEALQPDVLIVTGDHSTPSRLRAHSWHPVPVLLASAWTRSVPVSGFGERDCLSGELGILPAVELMSLALAHAGRLAKYGA
ncbi:MAG: 2,3-bisphosphoglycerate-independent phosphoglycerate mutase [Longimicrobiales bacterium]